MGIAVWPRETNLPVAINTPPPKQFKTDKMKFLRSVLLFFIRGALSIQNGSKTAIVVTTTIAISRIDFIIVTDAILIGLGHATNRGKVSTKSN